MEIIYSVNGYYFKEFGVNVESSSGFGALKRKDPENYDFPEQNGSSPDLRNPYYEQREMKFECWISANSFQQLYTNFKNFIAQFQKPDTQRLIIEYPLAKTRVYQVYMVSDVDLKHRIKQGKCFAKFDLKLIEPNPIKRVCVAYGARDAMLKYNSPEETEIFLPNNEKLEAHSNVDILLDLTEINNVSMYNYKGRNLLLNSWDLVSTNVQKLSTSQSIWGGKTYYFSFEDYTFENYEEPIITVEFRTVNNVAPPIFIDLQINVSRSFGIYLPNTTIYEIYLHNRKSGTINMGAVLYLSGVSFRTDFLDVWTIAPEDAKYVVVAGNVRKLTNFIFQGSVLWSEL